MNSQKNVLQVLVSDFQAHSNAATVDALPDGELGFFDSEGVVAATGAGRFVVNRGGKFIESIWIENFVGWTALKAYAAPTLHKETITLAAAVVAGTYYQLSIEMDIKGMTGKYIKQGVYKAVTGDSVTTVAAALVASLNASLAREGNTALTITSALGVITIEQKAQTYVPGKKLGWAVPFTSALTEGPEADIQFGTVTVAGSKGVGTGPYVHAKEYFAWGNQDAFRYNGWRNNFEPVCYSDYASTYNVLAVNEKQTDTDTATGTPVVKDISVIVAFKVGTAPAV